VTQVSTTDSSPDTSGRQQSASLERARGYFFSDVRRTVQTVLGLIWLLDGALQFQSFMYGKGFIRTLTGMAPAQPHWLASPLLWGSHTMQAHQTLYNTTAALIQIAIGLGILYRPTIKQALVVSFAWALVVWWFGEAFGMLFMNMANPLTGAPGAVILYAIIGALIWPNEQPGGLIGINRARILWANLWILMGLLWLLAVNSSANATYDLIKAAPAGTPWLATLQNAFMTATQGHGLIIALTLAALSITIGLTVALNYKPRTFLTIAITLNLTYWFIGQGLGGIFTGTATDPNAGPLFILLAIVLYSFTPVPERVPRATATGASAGVKPTPTGATASGVTAARAAGAPVIRRRS
jgi:hypothetical protein